MQVRPNKTFTLSAIGAQADGPKTAKHCKKATTKIRVSWSQKRLYVLATASGHSRDQIHDVYCCAQACSNARGSSSRSATLLGAAPKPFQALNLAKKKKYAHVPVGRGAG